MKIEREGETLNVSELKELDQMNSKSFGATMREALPGGVKNIVIDLSETASIDCTGLGALIALHKLAQNQNPGISIRLLNLAPPVRQILALTRLDGIFQTGKA